MQSKLSNHTAIVIALSLFALWISLLSTWFSSIAEHYFPYAEEWSLFAHSLPGLADPVEWVLRGFGDYLPAYEHLSIAGTNFIRPVYNAGTWLRGYLFGDSYPLFLYFNFAIIAACSAACFYVSSRLSNAEKIELQWPTLAVALAIPLLPSMASVSNIFQAAFVPMMAYDPMIAAIAILACYCYHRSQYLVATILVTLALFTKEQALPLAIAIPLIHAWNNRRNWRSIWPTVTLLSTPLFAWALLRLNAYGHIYSGTYVMNRENSNIVKRFAVNLLQLPWYAPSPKLLLQQPFSVYGALIIANIACLMASGIFILQRWREQALNAFELTVIGSYGFLAIVGLNSRFGALFHTCLAVVLLQPSPSNKLAIYAKRTALTSLLVTCAIWGGLSWQAYPQHSNFWLTQYQISKNYVRKLEELPDGSQVVVLNDPSTAYTSPMTIAQSTRLHFTELSKASDYPWKWPTPLNGVKPTECIVQAERVNPNEVRLYQSCGFQLLGVPSNPDNKESSEFKIGNGHIVKFSEPDPDSKKHLSLAFYSENSDVLILYFDPATNAFYEI